MGARGLPDAFELALKVRAQAARIAELEGGAAIAAEVELRRRLQRGYEARVRSLERDLRERERENSRMIDAWFEVFEQVAAERDEAVANAMRAASAQEERALRAERRADELRDELLALGARMRGLEAELEEARGQVAKLTAQVNRDFENSSVPSSMQPAGRKRVPNTREATGRGPGAQPGHPHHPRRAPEPTRTVELADPEGWEGDPDLYRTGGTVRKLVVSARVAVDVTEYVANVWRRRSTGGRLHAPFPGGLVDEVTYDASAEALAFMLTAGCNASLGNAVGFLREASGGALSMSVGKAWSLGGRFAARSEAERSAAVSSLMSSPVMHADFTVANVGGRQRQVLILANGGAAAMLPREHKGHEGVAGTPLEAYVGCAVHDHDVTFYSYGASHQECMQHVVRYLVGSTQNEPHLTWNSLMLEHVRSMLHWRGSLAAGAEPDPEEVAAMEERYDEILRLAEAEYAEHPPTKYYRDGYNLFVRMRDYRESHLLFLHDLRVPPDNSLCERKARLFKRRQRACIAFRSDGGLEAACNAIAVIDGLRAGGRDVLAGITEILSRPAPAKAAEG